MINKICKNVNSTAAVGMGSNKEDQNIAQATSADRAEMAAARAAYQKEKLKAIKLKTRQQQLKNKDLRAKNRAIREKQTLKKGETTDGK